MQLPLSSLSFTKLVAALRLSKKTCAVVEQCCGGLISASIMAQPGASHVYLGGSVVYSTRQCKPLLLNDESLYQSLLLNNESPPKESASSSSSQQSATTTASHDKALSEEEAYIQSKVDWTAKTSVAFCKELNVDYVIAEGGASGPTFRPAGMTTGFAAIAVAGKLPDGRIAVLRQDIVRSTAPGTERVDNMQLFANAAADMAHSIVVSETEANVNSLDKDDHKLLQTAINTGEKETVDSMMPLSSYSLDRATHLRSNAAALAALEERDDALVSYVVLRGAKILVDNSSTHFQNLALLSPSQLSALIGRDKPIQKTFLGLISHEKQSQDPTGPKTAVFGIDLLDETSSAEYDNLQNYANKAVSFVDTRTTAPLFTSSDNQLALYATAMAGWQRRTKHCARCGGPVALQDGATSAQCTRCKTKSWPRQDPSMIAVISSRDGQRVLLGHAKRHPPKLYTVLAGFVEAGETFEAAVARETFEETGVCIDEGSTKYIGSQPWPFPQSCMVGFTATADDNSPLVVDPNELEHAAWFDRADVAQAATVTGSTMQRAVAEAALANDPSLPLLIPPKGVIARKLIDLWLEDKPR